MSFDDPICNGEYGPPLSVSSPEEHGSRSNSVKESIDPYPNNPAKIPSSVLDKLTNQSTLFDQVAVEHLADRYNFGFSKFFNHEEIVSQYVYKPEPFGVKEFQYALWLLSQQKKIKLWGFDPTAALGAVDISATETIKVPISGNFVITLNDHKNDSDAVILEVLRIIEGTEYHFHGLTYERLHTIVNLIENITKTHNVFKNKVFSLDGKFFNPSKDGSLGRVVLPENLLKIVKSDIIDFIDYKLPFLKKHNLPTKRGIIFEGLPGTGKSFLVRTLINTVRTSFIIVSSIDRISQISQCYKLARRIAPAIVVFEDIDTYLYDRQSGDGRLSPLLNELDGVEQNDGIVTILTTNKLSWLDDAIKNRPGRFDRVVTFDLPNEKLTRYMLETFCKNLDTSSIDFEMLATTFGGKYSGAHLQNIVQTACINFIDKTTAEDDEIILTTENLINASKELELSFKKGSKRAGFGK